MQYYFDHPWYYVLYVIALAGSVAAGFAIAHHQFLRKERDWRPTGLEAAIIGLFGLMLSFTFLAAHNATRDRNRMVHDQADAMASLRRNSLLMHPDVKAETHRFLLAMLDLQLRADSADHDERSFLHRETEQLLGTTLTNLVRYGLVEERQAEVGALIGGLDAVTAAYYRSHYAYAERIPRLMIDLLLLSALLIGFLVGFMNGMSGLELRQMITAILFVLIVALTIRTVLDMNNPYRGSIRPDIENLSALRDALMKSDR